jgi:hypothetical protein
MADELPDLIRIARETAPDVPSETWDRVESAIRGQFKAQSIYIASRRKRNLIDDVETAGKDTDAVKLAGMLGVSVRRIQQIKKLLWQ